MAEQRDVATPVDEVFLKMIGWILRCIGTDRPAAMRTSRRGCHFDERVVFYRRGAEPAGMAHRRAPLKRLSLGRILQRLDLGDTALALAIGGELVLPLQLELELQTLDLALERFVLGRQIRDRLSGGIQLTIQPVDGVAARVRDLD
jgi:hypothetical protein